MQLFTSFLLLSTIVSTSYALNILIVFVYDGKSHQWVFGPFVQRLAAQGHQLTALVHNSFNVKENNYKEILLSKDKNQGGNVFELDMFDMPVHVSALINPVVLSRIAIDSCHRMFSNPEVQTLLASEQKFDLILTEIFNNECSLPFVDKFKAPFIGLSSTTMMAWDVDKFAQPDNPSYIPMSNCWYGHKMNFLERTQNTIATILFKTMYWFVVRENQFLAEKYFNKNMPPFQELKKTVSLILINSHFSLNFPRPSVPGVIEIGGVHITEPKRLPKNIEKFINESTHGVIYFSLGSMIKGHTFPQEKRQEFLKAFARLPQRVLWKWENETMPGKPDNVMIQKWMPQFDILSHPNVKAFISHGGLLGTTEAVHCGVPMLVMPQYGDQHTNAKAIEVNGGGVILYLRDATEEKVYQGLKTILDPEFKEKAQALSERFRDRPMSPMDTAIYWVEYVARHKGAPHMRTAAVDMPLYQYLLLDVLAFLAAIAIILLYITYKFTRLIFRVIFPKKKMKQS